MRGGKASLVALWPTTLTKLPVLPATLQTTMQGNVVALSLKQRDLGIIYLLDVGFRHLRCRHCRLT